MMAFMSPRLWLALGLAAVLAFTHAFVYRSGKAAVRADWDSAIATQLRASVAAEQETRRMESLRAGKVIEAQNAQAKRTQILQASAAGARTESAGLRNDLARNTSDLSSAAIDACRKYATTANAILGDMAAEGGGMAEKADSHSSDALTLQQAWPK